LWSAARIAVSGVFKTIDTVVATSAARCTQVILLAGLTGVKEINKPRLFLLIDAQMGCASSNDEIWHAIVPVSSTDPASL
jgi:hypothetical protein